MTPGVLIKVIVIAVLLALIIGFQQQNINNLKKQLKENK